METIKNYLENLFKALPKTDQILRLKNELLLNMEEKYHELKSQGKSENEAIGTVISEFGNIDELLNEMEISIPESGNKLPILTAEAADIYIYVKKKCSFWIAIGVMLCILGAAGLILTSQLIESRMIFEAISDNIKNFFPVILLLVILVPAITLFIYSGTNLEKYKYIEEGAFSLDTSAKSLLSERHESISRSSKIAVIVGVCLCVLSPIAIFIGSMISEGGAVYGVCVLLLIVAAAVYLFITFGSVEDAYKKLLQIDEYSPTNRKNDKVIGAVASVVWPLAVCIFLLCGFLRNLWYICWIVFPITGILFGAFCSFYSAIKGEGK